MLAVAACHIHSNWSYDGKWTIADLASEFLRRGWRILMLTEHDRGFTERRRIRHREECVRFSCKDLLILPGIEYSDPSNTVHMLVWGDVRFAGEAQPTATLLRHVRSSNGIAVLAHPSRKRAWSVFDPAWTQDLSGLEIWNRKTDGWAPSRDAIRLLKATGLPAFAGMDFHDRRQFFPLGLKLDVRGGLSEENVLAALRNQQFAASAFGLRITAESAMRRFGFLRIPEFVRRGTAWSARRVRGKGQMTQQAKASTPDGPCPNSQEPIQGINAPGISK